MMGRSRGQLRLISAWGYFFCKKYTWSALAKASRRKSAKEGIKYVFHHDIFRASDEQLCFRGKVELVCIVNGRLANSPDYDAAFAKYIES